MKIGMLFPGYSHQYVGMGKELYDNSRLMQEYFEEASTCLNMNFVRLCFASSEQELGIITNTYVALFLVSSAIAGLLKEKGIKPEIVAGYGIGEYAALFTAGALTLPDGLYFLAKYAQFYHDFLATFTARALQVADYSVTKLKKLSHDTLFIAAYHTKHKSIVAGASKEITKLKNYLEQEDAQVKEYPAQAGLHSVLMAPVVQQLEIYLEKIDFHDTTTPWLSGVDAAAITKGRMMRDRIIKQIISPIRWDKIMQKAHEWDMIIEIGPGTSLKKMFEETYPDKSVISVNKPADLDALLALINQSGTITT